MKAVGFDLGDTLIYYDNVPLNWRNLYRSALIKIAQDLNLQFSNEIIHNAEIVLSRYNTRINPREHEVNDIEIFDEILTVWGLSDEYTNQVINTFFGFFQQRSMVYPEAITLLKELKRKDIRIGILTDVPYGMSKSLVLRDIEPIKKYVDVLLTSVDVGYRKPRPEGFVALCKQLKVSSDQMMFVGNEEKDVTGANLTGIKSILIDKEDQNNEWNQQISIRNLNELLNYL
ncbi:hypothetical protein H70357_21925 [Paenibacillus sp. FSL H7-0357]|uniref:HAD family hydrolase n=1 Tax=unclassified Paenibacillus TaxID=185978 RepID=UPI0004F63C3D|nr:HAD family hydrolase [Paenibacillus sp. FSL H7-0357]AIQ19069.1 hypothetical protein H70357_21925 [Paenibacillus sp. FSL H7-0357]